MTENQSRSSEEASRLFRVKGLHSVSVADVMIAASFTHAAFIALSARRVAWTPSQLRLRTTLAAWKIFVPIWTLIYRRATVTMRQMGAPWPVWPSALRHQAMAARLAMGDRLQAQIDHIGTALRGQPSQQASRLDRKLGGVRWGRYSHACD